MYSLRYSFSKMVPGWVYRMMRKSIIAKWEQRPDADYIRQRVEYNCRLMYEHRIPKTCPSVGNPEYLNQRMYRIDLWKSLRWFPKHYRYLMMPGDLNFVPDMPTFVESRPVNNVTNSRGIELQNAHSVLLKLNRLQNFATVKDRLSFSDKKSMAVFRDIVDKKAVRQLLFHRFLGNPILDIGDISPRKLNPREWRKRRMSVRKLLRHKFLLQIEGGEVSRDLKWMLSTNSLVVSTRPRYETWFMEGALIPDFHYVEIRDDLSDLEYKLHFYLDHPDEAEKIIANAHNWVAQFQDKRRERIVEILTVQRYFDLTQNPFPQAHR